MYTLYGFAGSGSAAVEAALEMAGVAYTRVDAASWEPGSAVDTLHQLNPLVQIPTLRLPDGSVMTESAAILIHLALTHPSAGLLPADPALRAQCLRGLVFIAANCYAAIGIIDYPERWWYPASDDTAMAHLRAGARARLYLYWELFADTFREEPFLSGPAPGALDLLAVVVSKWSGARGHLASVRPNFAAQLARIESHPVVAAVLARHWSE